MKPIAVVGSSNTDMIVELDRIPAPGETLLGRRFFMAHGGKGANQAVAAAKAGGRVAFLCRIGSDSFGDQALAQFKKHGILTAGVIRDRQSPSGVALIFVGAGGENSIAVASGANARLAPADVWKHRRLIQSSAALVLQLETPIETVEAAAGIAYAHGIPVILNPAPARRLPARLLKKIAVLTPNETEAATLTGIPIRTARDAKAAADALRGMGVGTVIVTLGAKGALLASAAGTRHIPGFKVKAVDTTAAGDTFNGALAVALAEGKEMADAVVFANAAAALSVTKPGAQPSLPSRSEIVRFLKRRATPHA